MNDIRLFHMNTGENLRTLEKVLVLEGDKSPNDDILCKGTIRGIDIIGATKFKTILEIPSEDVSIYNFLDGTDTGYIEFEFTKDVTKFHRYVLERCKCIYPNDNAVLFLKNGQVSYSTGTKGNINSKSIDFTTDNTVKDSFIIIALHYKPLSSNNTEVTSI